MKFKFPTRDGHNPRDLIRKCSYGEWQDREHEVTSYTRKLGGGNYPRFHVHLVEQKSFFEVSLHLDQKQESYSNTTAHSGEYEGKVVEDEARRITAVIADIYEI
ncbi:hypothetical protein HQ571_03470 [Candidatus Kuenenbacteria bacterium]|nr:hypothetical protein [Candidatus Kuenenbacteria bacterium]